MRLENWSVVNRRGPYQAPEQGKMALAGIVTGHPKKADGSRVTTSPIVGTVGGWVKTRSGSLYTLGEVDPAYEAEYPGARERLLRSYAKQA